MTPLFQKLNLKDTHGAVTILSAPESFEPELAALTGVEIRRDLKKAPEFLIAFATTAKDVDAGAKAASQTEGDAVVWFAYPKQSSKKYQCEFNRDNGWAAVGAAGFEPVRMVAIDADWSALRFRRVEFIKNMTRDPKHRLTQPAK